MKCPNCNKKLVRISYELDADKNECTFYFWHFGLPRARDCRVLLDVETGENEIMEYVTSDDLAQVILMRKETGYLNTTEVGTPGALV